MLHKCIKPSCETEYQDDEPDAYFCQPCRELNKSVAQRIDTNVKARMSPKPVSNFQRYEQLRGGSKFVNAKHFLL